MDISSLGALDWAILESLWTQFELFRNWNMARLGILKIVIHVADEVMKIDEDEGSGSWNFLINDALLAET